MWRRLPSLRVQAASLPPPWKLPFLPGKDARLTRSQGWLRHIPAIRGEKLFLLALFEQPSNF